jgi:hypothetical protein
VRSGWWGVRVHAELPGGAADLRDALRLGPCWDGGWVRAVSGGPCGVPFRSCRQTGVQGQVVGRCSVTRRAERASRPGTLMSWARMVPVVARASKAEARVPAARVRLKAIAAQTSQALLAQNLRRLLDGVTAGTTASPRGAIREVRRSLTGWWSRRSGSGFGPQPRTRAASRGRPGPPTEPVLRLILAQLW